MSEHANQKKIEISKNQNYKQQKCRHIKNNLVHNSRRDRTLTSCYKNCIKQKKEQEKLIGNTHFLLPHSFQPLLISPYLQLSFCLSAE